MDRIVECRDKPYLSFEDCMQRAELNPNDARLLIKAGCFDRLEPDRNRPELLWQIALSTRAKPITDQGDLFSNPASPNPGQTIQNHSMALAKSGCNSGQSIRNLLPGFGEAGLRDNNTLESTRHTPKPSNYSEKTILSQEVETLGFLISRHPLELYRNRLKNSRIIKVCDLHKHIGKRVEFIGWLVTGKVVMTRHKEAMEFVTFEDTTGLVETVFFPYAFKRFSHILSHTRPYRLFGKVEEDFGAVTVTVERVGYL